MSLKKRLRSVDREVKRRAAKEWERHAADFVPKRIHQMRGDLLHCFRHGGLESAKTMLDLHVNGLQTAEKGFGRGFTQAQTDAMIQNLQSLFESLKKKAMQQKH